MSYDDEQFVESQICFYERVLADIRAGRVFLCHDCGWWCAMAEKCQDAWGGDRPVCIKYLETRAGTATCSTHPRRNRKNNT